MRKIIWLICFILILVSCWDNKVITNDIVNFKKEVK